MRKKFRDEFDAHERSVSCEQQRHREARGLSDRFLHLVRPRWAVLHRVARRYVEPGDVGDVVQETLLRAWRSFDELDAGCCKPSWLFVILRSVVVDRHRAAACRVRLVPVANGELTESAPVDPTAPFPEFPAMSDERFREFLDDRVARALDALEPRFREVIVLAAAGELTYREIATVLECPVGTVMSRMARGRRELRENLAEYARGIRWAGAQLR